MGARWGAFGMPSLGVWLCSLRPWEAIWSEVWHADEGAVGSWESGVTEVAAVSVGAGAFGSERQYHLSRWKAGQI